VNQCLGVQIGVQVPTPIHTKTEVCHRRAVETMLALWRGWRRYHRADRGGAASGYLSGVEAAQGREEDTVGYNTFSEFIANSAARTTRQRAACKDLYRVAPLPGAELRSWHRSTRGSTLPSTTPVSVPSRRAVHCSSLALAAGCTS